MNGRYGVVFRPSAFGCTPRVSRRSRDPWRVARFDVFPRRALNAKLGDNECIPLSRSLGWLPAKQPRRPLLSRNSAKRHDPILSQVSLIERELSLAAKRVKERLLLAGYQQACPGSHDGEDVVCAHLQDETYRLRPLPDKYEHDNPLGHILDVQIAPGVHIHGVGIRITF